MSKPELRPEVQLLLRHCLHLRQLDLGERDRGGYMRGSRSRRLSLLQVLERVCFQVSGFLRWSISSHHEPRQPNLRELLLVQHILRQLGDEPVQRDL